MVFEDAHWIDPTSRELLDLTVDRVRQLRVMLAITFRPEFQPPWGGRAHVMSLALNRLGDRYGEALVQTLAGNAALTAEIVAEIVERTDGVPLFVEELTKAVLESAAQGDRVAAVLATKSQTSLSVPATLHASLMARLDRLGPSAKEIAQIGAVLGREFAYELIEPVAQRPERELQAALDQLNEAGLLFCRGTVPHASYLFKHALVQDAAYSTLLRGRRQELHARVAAVLEERFADLVERQPELLAHHLTGAAATELAVAQWLKAGQFAAARSAHREAIGHFERGLVLISSLPQSMARDGIETELQLGLGLSSLTAEGFVSLAAKMAYGRARELSEQHGDARRLFTAVYGLWQTTAGAGDLLKGRVLSRRLLQLTAADPNGELRLQAHHSAWATNLHGGHPTAAREHTAAGRRLYDPEQHRSHRLRFGGHDPGVCARMFGGLAEWVLGHPKAALVSDHEAVGLAEQLAHPLSLEDALLGSSLLHLDRGEPGEALRRLDAAEALAIEQRLGFVREPRFLRGAGLIAEGAIEEGVVCVRAGLASAVGQAVWRTFGLAVLSDGLIRLGDGAEARVALSEAVQIVETKGERLWEAELHRLNGLVLIAENQPAEAERNLTEALAVARRQQARAYELRAATNLARLWGEQGRRGEARELLAPVFGWFTEGFDTADLKEAKALLDELA
jgi:predicted ATPase